MKSNGIASNSWAMEMKCGGLIRRCVEKSSGAPKSKNQNEKENITCRKSK